MNERAYEKVVTLRRQLEKAYAVRAAARAALNQAYDVTNQLEMEVAEAQKELLAAADQDATRQRGEAIH